MTAVSLSQRPAQAASRSGGPIRLKAEQSQLRTGKGRNPASGPFPTTSMGNASPRSIPAKVGKQSARIRMRFLSPPTGEGSRQGIASARFAAPLSLMALLGVLAVSISRSSEKGTNCEPSLPSCHRRAVFEGALCHLACPGPEALASKQKRKSLRSPQAKGWAPGSAYGGRILTCAAALLHCWLLSQGSTCFTSTAGSLTHRLKPLFLFLCNAPPCST